MSADNTELACAFIQKTAVEKAVPEIDKRLAEVSSTICMVTSISSTVCKYTLQIHVYM